MATALPHDMKTMTKTPKNRCPADLLVAMTETERDTIIEVVIGTVEALTIHSEGWKMQPMQWKLDPSRGWVRA